MLNFCQCSEELLAIDETKKRELQKERLALLFAFVSRADL
jgi:hypothetical protein